ncbi:MAG: diacylglycerol kinase family lipid kinase [Caldilineales bacterium]|nr:diacylglycerol kinase family lipid kinase [Caldilineales bacterium]
MADTLVIINPYSNRGDGRHQLDLALQALSSSGMEFEIALTEYRGHAIKLAEEAARNGAAMVIAAGGDGTVNEVVNGIMQANGHHDDIAPTTLGILPVGSGNDFAGGLGMDQGLDDAVFRLRRGFTRMLDVGYAEHDAGPPLYFVNILGGGFDARINVEAHKIKRLRGFSIYLVAVLKTIAIYYRTPLTTIHYGDVDRTFPMLMTLVCNGPRLGGGFLAAPESSHDDGLFDLVIVRKTSRLDMLWMIPKFMKGKHLDHPKVTMARTNRVEIESSEGFPSQADGEMLGMNVKKLTISIQPQRLRVVV